MRNKNFLQNSLLERLLRKTGAERHSKPNAAWPAFSRLHDQEFPFLSEERLGDASRSIAISGHYFGPNSLFLGLLGFVYARLDRDIETWQILKELNVPSQKQYIPGTTFALIYFGLGARVTSCAGIMIG